MPSAGPMASRVKSRTVCAKRRCSSVGLQSSDANQNLTLLVGASAPGLKRLPGVGLTDVRVFDFNSSWRYAASRPPNRWICRRRKRADPSHVDGERRQIHAPDEPFL